MKKYFYILGVCALSAGCGDRNLQDYQKQKVAEEISKIQPIIGIYSGEILSKSDQSSVGKLTFQIDADSRINLSTDQSTPTRQAVLKGTLQLESNKKITIPFSDGYFDSVTGEFQLNIFIRRKTTDEVTMQIKGFLVGDSLNGNLQVREYPERGAVFKLKKINADQIKPSVISKDSSISPEGGKPDTWIFREPGQNGKADRMIKFFIFQDTHSDIEDFLSNFVSVKIVDAAVDFNSGVQVIFSPSKWDLRTGTLKGGYKAETSSQSIDIRLDCISYLLSEYSNPNQMNQIGWNCRYINSTRGSVMEWKLLPEGAEGK
ncbi:MAG: hypothetical protein J0L93_03000 [Deltaproteobacteria bacterium]|nr:hypothetical protein [Deltaproteobacteria bacterium]